MSCDLLLLEHSLADRLSDRDEETLAKHLATCPDCRRQLQELAGDDAEWSRVSDVLRAASKKPGTSFYAPVRNDESLAVSQTDSDFEDDADSYIDFAVNFLDPARRDGSIGSLADIEILEVIGRGGMGIVLKGFQPELNRPVAVKVLAPHLATSGAARKRFAREAQAAAAIVHPNVMPILSVNSTGKLPYLIMPFVACESLQQRLDSEGPLPVVDVLRIGLQIAEGLAAAHAQGLIHRDVKPANILLEKGVDRVMLTDFGLARAVDDASLTRTGVIAGTPQYMSPEQARGESVDARSDQFSLGSVLYAMCTGRAPFRAETSYGILRRVTDADPREILEINAEMPDWLVGIVRKLHAKEPGRRFGSVREVGDLLERCLAHVQQPTAVALPDECRGMRQVGGRVQSVPDTASVRDTFRGVWGPRSAAQRMAVAGVAVIAILALMISNPFQRDQQIASDQRFIVSPRSVELPSESELIAKPPADNIPQWSDDLPQQLRQLQLETDVLNSQSNPFWPPPDGVELTDEEPPTNPESAETR